MPRPTKKIQFGTGAVADVINVKDRIYDGIASGASPFDWDSGYDIENEIGSIIPIKNQDGSSSCVGQAWAYYIAVLNAIETGAYVEVSPKAIYSQIALSQGGAYIREGGKLTVNWGAVLEALVLSYDNDNPPKEPFMTDKSWMTDQISQAAKKLSAKEYRMIADVTMEVVAQGIRDNYGVVGGVYGANNGSWSTLEPEPGAKDWGHALFLGKAGKDSVGKYIATPNSWGNRFTGQWQKLREEWFVNKYMFNPWLLVDQPNFVSAEVSDLISQADKGLIIENEAPGRKGIIYDGKLMEVANGREGNAAIYLLESKGVIRRVSKIIFDQIPKGNNF